MLISYWLFNENPEKDETPTAEILFQEMEEFLSDFETANNIIKKPGLNGR